MHDLVYDLATIILGQQLIALNDPKELTQNSLEKNYCRHMQFINYQEQSIDRKKKFQVKLDLSTLQSATDCSFKISHSLNASICVSWT